MSKKLLEDLSIHDFSENKSKCIQLVKEKLSMITSLMDINLKSNRLSFPLFSDQLGFVVPHL